MVRSNPESGWCVCVCVCVCVSVRPSLIEPLFFLLSSGTSPLCSVINRIYMNNLTQLFIK